MNYEEEQGACFKCRNLERIQACYTHASRMDEHFEKRYCRYLGEFIDWDIYCSVCENGFEDRLS